MAVYDYENIVLIMVHLVGLLIIFNRHTLSISRPELNTEKRNKIVKTYGKQ